MPANILFVLQQQGGAWEASGHAIPGSWVALVGRIGAFALLFVFLVLVIRAFLRRERYRATTVLGADDLAALREELTAAERRTVGEIVVVVVERSDRHPAAAWLAAVSALLLGSALLATVLPWDVPALLLASQLALGALGYGLARWLPDFQRLFIRESRATEMAEEQAFQEFYRHGLHETVAKTGVLLFVSLLERRVIVLGDAGIDAKVDAAAWQDTTSAVLKEIAAGSLRDGLAAGIRKAGALLAEHFPWEEGDRNELPDRVIVRRE